MRNVIAIARKELGIYFLTPWAWVVLAAMMGIAGFFFIAMLAQFQRVHELAQEFGWQALGPGAAAYRNLTDGVVVQLWGIVMTITLFVAPFLSMRLFAEERKQKTFELLMTTPVRPIEIVVGKYLAGLGVLFATVGVTLVFPIVLELFGTGQSGRAVEWSTALLGFGGLLLWGATCMALGMFISSLTESQMVAAFITFVILVPWLMLKGVAQSADEPFKSLLSYLSFDQHMDPLLRGLLDVKALVFFVSVILLSVFLTHRRIEAFRWA